MRENRGVDVEVDSPKGKESWGRKREVGGAALYRRNEMVPRDSILAARTLSLGLGMRVQMGIKT